MSAPSRAETFYSVQRRQWRRSLAILFLLFVFYYACVALVAGGLEFSVRLFFFDRTPGYFLGLLPPEFFIRTFFIAFLIAAVHYYDARRSGPDFIKRRLKAQPPDTSDRYHVQYANMLEEMRLACGLPKVQGYVVPSFAVNSMAMTEKDGTPAVLITEGMLAELSRDELQAAIAHELAHIIRGDAFYVSLVCSLANLFERIRFALEDSTYEGKGGRDPSVTAMEDGALFAITGFTELLMGAVSTLLSRQRETLADAGAVEICRQPLALARAIYKSHLKHSFVSDFASTYGPMFIVSPDSDYTDQRSEGFLERILSSHPPLMDRISILAQLGHAKTEDIVRQVWHQQQLRLSSREKRKTFEETEHKKQPPASGKSLEKKEKAKQPLWRIQDPNGGWLGPYPLAELMSLPFFTPQSWLRKEGETAESPAHGFPEVCRALGSRRKSPAKARSGSGLCPRCRTTLSEESYEGALIQRCPRCGGCLVGSFPVERILARHEQNFSESLLQKAEQYQEEFFVNPLALARRQGTPGHRGFACPHCGSQMVPRPYSYQYFVPVDRCLSCSYIWFDADELEILQVLVEKAESSEEEQPSRASIL